ncbi:hypothetical protein AOLI_G00244640 [Acnodon oligacanthus]
MEHVVLALRGSGSRTSGIAVTEQQHLGFSCWTQRAAKSADLHQEDNRAYSQFGQILPRGTRTRGHMWPNQGSSTVPFNPAFPPPPDATQPVPPNTGYPHGQNPVYPPNINPAMPPTMPYMAGGQNPYPPGFSPYVPPPGTVNPGPHSLPHGGCPVGLPGAIAGGGMVIAGHKMHKKMKKAKKKAHKAEKTNKHKKHCKHSSSSSSSSSSSDSN